MGWEVSIVTAELADDLTQTKFIPVLRQGSFKTDLPVWLKNRVGVDLSADTYSEEEFQLLLRDLHDAPIATPPLGPAPVYHEGTIAAAKTAPTGSLQCDFSPRAQLLSRELSMRVFPVVQECSWSEHIELKVLAETSETDAIFSRLRGSKEHLVVAFGFDVAIAKLTTLNREVSGRKALWKASFEPSRTEFSNDMEMGTSSTTADEFAEKRVRRLLLNEKPMLSKSPKENFIGFANEMMSENLVQGLNSVVKIEQSPFLDLHRAFGHDPQSFIEIAWIAAITDLKLSAAVEHIHHLALGLVEDTMAVDFAGRRHRKYVNAPPYEIKIQGTVCVASESEVARDSQVINSQAPSGQTEDSWRRHSAARRLLAPELQRTIDRVLYIHGRAAGNFISHSANTVVKPTDLKQDFIPHWPKLYPNAPQVRDLAEKDAAALIAYYDSLHALNDDVNDWWGREGHLPVNLFNTFLHRASKCLRLALVCIEKFELEALIPPPYESWGTISFRINQALKSEEQARNAHLARFKADAGR